MVQSMPSLAPGSASAILNMQAKDILSKQVLWGRSDDSVQDALEKIQQAGTSCMLIGNSAALEGIVTWIDVAEAVSIYLRPIFSKWRRPIDDATLQIKLKVIMTRPVRTIKPKTHLGAILEDMCQHRLRCLPVVNDDGKVEGVVTASDVFRFLLKMSPDFSITDAPPMQA
jgi:CBS-domain-containing membrane protein